MMKMQIKWWKCKYNGENANKMVKMQNYEMVKMQIE